jgi:broad specificity phosphatase PhoE
MTTQKIKIRLVRHGQPTCHHEARINRTRLSAWLIEYHHAGILPNSHPGEEVLSFGQHGKVLCSDLRRSIESARVIQPHFESSPLFREHELPVPPIPLFKFSTHVWDLVGKIFWVLGYSPLTESFKETRERARLAAEKLTDEAASAGFITLVGHGTFNVLIGRELKKLGFRANGWPKFSYWSFVDFSK